MIAEHDDRMCAGGLIIYRSEQTAERGPTPSVEK
jgi:hypothetical protein